MLDCDTVELYHTHYIHMLLPGNVHPNFFSKLLGGVELLVDHFESSLAQIKIKQRRKPNQLRLAFTREAELVSQKWLVLEFPSRYILDHFGDSEIFASILYHIFTTVINRSSFFSIHSAVLR